MNRAAVGYTPGFQIHDSVPLLAILLKFNFTFKVDPDERDGFRVLIVLLFFLLASSQLMLYCTDSFGWWVYNM